MPFLIHWFCLQKKKTRLLYWGIAFILLAVGSCLYYDNISSNNYDSSSELKKILNEDLKVEIYIKELGPCLWVWSLNKFLHQSNFLMENKMSIY